MKTHNAIRLRPAEKAIVCYALFTATSQMSSPGLAGPWTSKWTGPYEYAEDASTQEMLPSGVRSEATGHREPRDMLSKSWFYRPELTGHSESNLMPVVP